MHKFYVNCLLRNSQAFYYYFLRQECTLQHGTGRNAGIAYTNLLNTFCPRLQQDASRRCRDALMSSGTELLSQGLGLACSTLCACFVRMCLSEEYVSKECMNRRRLKRCLNLSGRIRDYGLLRRCCHTFQPELKSEVTETILRFTIIVDYSK